MFALSGVDIALWDIAGKATGQPLFELFGGARRKQIPTYASLFQCVDKETVAERARAAVDEGYRHVKLHQRGEEDLCAAREAVGPDIAIMMDVNCAWSLDEAREIVPRLKSHDLLWLEEPIFPPEDFRSLAILRTETGIALAAGESACTAFEFQRMIDSAAVNYLQPDVIKVGGITEFRKVLTLAEAQGCTVMPHTPIFGPGLLASLHLLATMPDECLAEFFYYKSIEATLYGDAIRVTNGMMTVPEGPGLGLDPDLNVIKEYEIK